MLEKMAQMLAAGFICGAFLVGVAGGLTVTFLFLCRLVDISEDWHEKRQRKRYERELEARRRAYEASQIEAETQAQTTAS